MFNRLDNLEGKVAVIIGGAGQVGYATAIRLAEQKCRVVIVTRKETNELHEKINLLPNKELKHFFIIADVTDTISLKNAADQVLIQAKRCDILINSAGYTRTVNQFNLEELTDQIFDEIVKINLRGVYATIREFAPMLRQTNDGVIINISSAASERAGKSNIAYVASKAGINILTETLAKRLAPSIRVLAISPSFMEKSTSGVTEVKSESFIKEMVEKCPLKRIGNGDDIANTIVAYLTHIRFATGTIITVDGGRNIT
jgi:NAD(P)-dependent dehydrogenase (short-subunit alcohol dehydrogenase family)